MKRRVICAGVVSCKMSSMQRIVNRQDFSNQKISASQSGEEKRPAITGSLISNEVDRSVQLPTYADNVALPAFAGRAAVRRAAIDRYLLPAIPQQQTCGTGCCGPRLGQTEGQTDRRTDGRKHVRCIDPASHSMWAAPTAIKNLTRYNRFRCLAHTIILSGNDIR